MDSVDVILVNNDRVTIRVGDVFLKVDADQDRADREVEAIGLAPVPVPDVLWREPPVLALSAVRGSTLGRLGEPSDASPAAWAAAGATLRHLHDAPLPPWPAPSVDVLTERLHDGCDWLLMNNILSETTITRNRERAQSVLRQSKPAFIHGDLHLEHLFVDGESVTGLIDWSEARQGDPLYDIASLTLANEDRLEDLIAGYAMDLDRDLIRGWWSFRCLCGVRWLSENGYGEPETFPEVAVLRSLG